MTVRKHLKARKDWIEVFPYGVTLGLEVSRPMMIFKDKEEKHILPVWLSPIDAGIAISQEDVNKTSNSPHQLTWQLLKPLGVSLEKCLFTEVLGHQQYVELYFNGHDLLKKLKVRADEAISFCLSAKGTQFFCTRDYIEKCQNLDAEMLTGIESQSASSITNPHPYLN